MSNVSVLAKEVTTLDGRTLFLKIVQHGDKRGWMTKQLIEYFGKSAGAISQAAKAENIGGSVLDGTQLDPLKSSNVVNINTTHMKFYTEEEVARIAIRLKSKTAHDMVVYGFGVGVRAAQGKSLNIGLPEDLTTITEALANRALALTAKIRQVEEERNTANTRADQAETKVAHLSLVVDSSKIGPEAISQLTKTIAWQALQLAPDHDHNGYRTAGVIKRIVKACYAGAKAGATYKEIPVKEYAECLAFVQAITSDLVEVGRLYKNQDNSLEALKRHIQALGGQK